MSYRLMAVDMDGTLLDSNNNITPGTVEAIRLAVEKGLVFTIATGRPIKGVEKYNKILDIDLPYITYNGAMVVMGKSEEILYETKMLPWDAKQIIELGEQYGVTVLIWKNSTLYITKMDDRVKQYTGIASFVPVLAENIDNLVEGGVTKVIWFDDVDKIARYQREIGQYMSENVNYHTTRPCFLEFVDKDASKAIAMQKLGEHLGIKQSEMIAVGDGYNDLSMIEYAGLGVAMGNAEDEIKKRADYITLSNDEDGVAHVIKKFILD